MSRTVHQTVVAVLLIAWLRSPVVAGPTPSDSSHHDRDGATTASATDTPWIDLAPSKVLAEIAEQPERLPDHKVAASLTLAGAYAAFTTWTYFAWYRNKHKTDRETCKGTIHWSYCWGGDGLFGATTYAGGADKLGHAWAGLIWARGGTELLHQWGGFDKRTSSIVGAVLSEALYFGVEIKDGAYYEFSYGDLAFDTLGVLAGLALSNSPRLDELFDFRVQYWPSKAYRRQLENDGNVNIAEDYTGETYLLAFHLGGIHALRDHKYGTWSRFVDLAIGFETRGYKPDPLPAEPDFDHHQKLFLGVTLNAQGIFDYLFEGRSKPAKKITHGVFEIFNIPYTTLPVLDTTRSSLITDPGGA
jgi:Predicted periplasmic lipoprotein (DUF2279)